MYCNQSRTIYKYFEVYWICNAIVELLGHFLATLGNSFDVETLFDVSVLYDLSVFPSYGHTFNEKVAAAQLLAISKV